jgi:hypothetical protein
MTKQVPLPPSPASLGLRTGAAIGGFQSARWSVRGVFSTPLKRTITILYALLGMVAAVTFTWNQPLPLRILVGVTAGVLVAVILWMLVALLVFLLNATLAATGRRVFYVGDLALLAVKRRVRNGNPTWEFTEHVARDIGKGQGAALREQLRAPFLEAADQDDVYLYGSAATHKLQQAYLQQFTTWGLVAEGKRKVARAPQ